MMNKHHVQSTVDTGSTINVIDQSVFDQLRPITNGTAPVKMKSKFQATIESWEITVATTYVTEVVGGCLLSTNTAEKLGLMNLHSNQVTTAKTSSHATHQASTADWCVSQSPL